MSRRFFSKRIKGGAVLLLAIFFPASQSFAFDPQLRSLEESRAFQEYAVRGTSELSQLIFLIDRFKEADIEIVYDGLHVNAAFAANVAKWFLSRQYRGQKAEEWIMQWANTTVPAGNVIWVKDKQGNFKAARRILLDELEKLKEACKDLCEAP